ncbi:MAG: SMC-Scp complex subunit ScpB [bacterium]|nr:SMC-Scp complex subunit ScpB [bacterium]
MNLKSILESILFVHGEPLSIKKLIKITEQKEEEIKEALNQLGQEYKDRGLVLIKKDNEWQIGSNPNNTKYIEKIIKDEFSEELSRAAIETAAIIAYKGPVTRIQIEHIRGVNSSFIVRNLLMRGLIERVENPKDARSFLYKISVDFLKHMGIASMEELPGFIELSQQKISIAEEPNTDGGKK